MKYLQFNKLRTFFAELVREASLNAPRLENALRSKEG